MSGETLERYIREYIAAQPLDPVTFAWQGGEPTLCGVPFFEKAVALQRKYGEGRKIENAIQTNGTLLDDQWGAFLSRENFLVGISIDGPRKLHDAYRVDRKGAGTFDQVMRGLDILKKHEVEFNTLTCVNRVNVDRAEDVYRFLRGIGSRFMQFIPIVERKPDATAVSLGLDHAVPPEPQLPDGLEPARPDLTNWSVPAHAYGDFLLRIFNRWIRNDVGKVYVQMFDVALGKWLGMDGGLCIFDETCGRALALEHDGSLYSCDHYVYPDFRLGKLGEAPLAELVDQEKQKKFGADKAETLPRFCRECEVRFACNGGCPKQRFETTPDGEAGLNYLCPGYKKFFTTVDPYMRVMADLYRAGRPVPEIMDWLKGPGREAEKQWGHPLRFK